MLCDALLLTWHRTGREKYLEPLRSMAAMRRQWLADGRRPGEPGSRDWCASKLSFLAHTLAKYRLLSSSGEFDAILAHDYAAVDLSADGPERPKLAKGLDEAVAGLRVNFPAFTSEVRFTDRVFAFARMYGADRMFPEALPANARAVRTEVLYAAATGDRGRFSVFPLNSVRWLTPPRDIAALVTGASRRQFEADLFHFGEKERGMSAELYLLASGDYTVEFRTIEGDPIGVEPAKLSVSGPRTRIAFTLPPRRLCRLRIAPVGQAFQPVGQAFQPDMDTFQPDMGDRNARQTASIPMKHSSPGGIP